MPATQEHRRPGWSPILGVPPTSILHEASRWPPWEDGTEVPESGRKDPESFPSGLFPGLVAGGKMNRLCIHSFIHSSNKHLLTECLLHDRPGARC